MATLKKEPSSVRFARGRGGGANNKQLPRLTHAYRPELHRQQTERVQCSPLGQALRHLTDDVGLGEAFHPEALAAAKMELGKTMEKVSMSLQRNQLGLNILPAVHLHCFAHWHVHPDTRVVCLLPVFFPKSRVIQRDAARTAIRLPPLSAKSLRSVQSNQQSSQADPASATSAGTQPPLVDVRTKDGVHLSPRKLHAVCARLVHSALAKRGIKSATSSELGLHVQLACGWLGEIVPCAVVPGEKGCYYVPKRFVAEPAVRGDVTWRPCFSPTEHDLLRSISSTDSGLRVGAMHVLCCMLSRDWRLAHITCYHAQTALLHDMDFHVDYSPRWQRSSLEACVRSLLATLQYFADRECLPHFSLNQLNLWDHVTPRQFAQARGALSRLMSNENALISLVRRASSEVTVSLDFGPS